MKRSLVLLVSVVALLLALSAPVAAHNVVIEPSGQGKTKELWVGGGPIPGKGAALVNSPIGMLPPSHFQGLPHACNATGSNSSAVTFIAPAHPMLPDSDPCQHGNQP